MKVSELRSVLKFFPEDMEVCFWNDDHDYDPNPLKSLETREINEVEALEVSDFQGGKIVVTKEFAEENQDEVLKSIGNVLHIGRLWVVE